MQEVFKLISGKFSPAEAADILISVINDKIKFHSLRSLNLRKEESEVRFNSVERIKELKEAKKTLEKMVLKAHRENLQIEINSTIDVKLTHSDENQL